MLHFLSDSVTAFGLCSSVILGILIIAVIRHGHVFSTLFANTLSEDSQNLQTEEKTNNEDEQNKTLGYSPDQLKEIARCAMLLHQYKPEEESRSGRASVSESQMLRRNLSDLTKRSRMLETDSVDDSDSMMVNFPNEENQDEVDMDDLIPDDITLSDENDEEESEAHISPQAIADIEAELLDSSILDESAEEPEGDGDEANTQDDLTRVAEGTVRSAVVIALEELGMEIVIDSLKQDDSLHYNVIKGEDLVEEVYAEGSQRVDCKSCPLTKTEQSNQYVAKPYAGGDYTNEICKPTKFSEPIKEKLGENKEVEVSGRMNSYERDCMTSGAEPHSSSAELADFLDLVSNEEVAGPSESQTSIDARLTADETSLIKSVLRSCDEKIFSIVSELLANYLTRRSMTDAIEELVDLMEMVDETTNESCGEAKLEKISKIHTEKKRLSEEELEEERRIQQNQLSDILVLMEQNPQMFGNVTKEVLTEQANLYCI